MAVFHPSHTSILPLRFHTLSFVLISLDSPTLASTLLTLAWLCSPSRLLASAHPSFFCHLAPPCLVDPVFPSVPDPSFCPHVSPISSNSSILPILMFKLSHPVISFLPSYLNRPFSRMSSRFCLASSLRSSFSNS